MNHRDRSAIAAYGYIDRRKQETLSPKDRVQPTTGALEDEDRCSGCAAVSCPCARTSTASSRRPETLRQASDWQKTKDRYIADSFCDTCSVAAAYGHQIGFSQVAEVCQECSGTRPTYRWAGEHALRWSGATPPRSPRPLEAA